MGNRPHDVPIPGDHGIQYEPGMDLVRERYPWLLDKLASTGAGNEQRELRDWKYYRWMTVGPDSAVVPGGYWRRTPGGISERWDPGSRCWERFAASA